MQASTCWSWTPRPRATPRSCATSTRRRPGSSPRVAWPTRRKGQGLARSALSLSLSRYSRKEYLSTRFPALARTSVSASKRVESFSNESVCDRNFQTSRSQLAAVGFARRFVQDAAARGRQRAGVFALLERPGVLLSNKSCASLESGARFSLQRGKCLLSRVYAMEVFCVLCSRRSKGGRGLSFEREASRFQHSFRLETRVFAKHAGRGDERFSRRALGEEPRFFFLKRRQSDARKRDRASCNCTSLW